MKKYILIIAILFALDISSCKKNYLGLETNPNNPSTTSSDLTLAAGLGAAVNIINILYPQDGNWMGYWTPSGNFTPNSALQQFQITNTTYSGVFNTLYANLTNLNNLQTVAAKDPKLANYQAIAMIMKAYDFQQLVDQFNDVPYSQAFQPSTIFFPAYDKGSDIYHDLGKQLDVAIALINKSTGATAPAADFIFRGDMTGWKKLANSIKLRLAIRVSTKFPQDPLIADLASTAAEGYLDENTQALANPGYSNNLANGLSQQSPFYLNYGLNTTNNPTPANVVNRANDFFINALKGFNDPRLNAVFYPTLPAGAAPTDVPTIIKGNVFGDTKTTLSNPNTSAIGPGLLQSPSQDAVLFSGSESLFLQAEAAVDGFIPGNAQDLYQRAITASFVALQAGSTTTFIGNGQFSYTPASAAQSAALAVTYYNQNIINVGWNASADKKQAIIYQKWISLVGYNNLEPHLEYERTGFPVLPNPVSIDPASVSDIIPLRQYYPLSEVSTNPDNVAKEGTIDIFKDPIFWGR
jgi:hypothetical protein